MIKNPRINSKGLNTSAIMGFAMTLNEVLAKAKPTHIAVAFDHGRTFRHELFAQYKAQREATPEDIRVSVPIIKQFVEAMNIPVLQVDGFEADDIIGTVAVRAADAGIETYMLTPDKDYAQIVRDGVFLFRPRHGGGYDTMGVEEVKAKYGVDSPRKIIDLLALMGDSSDNYPGCPGVGEKTAVKLISEFGDVDNLLANTDKIKGKLGEKISANRESILLSRRLATIRTDVPVATSLGDMLAAKPDVEKLRSLFAFLEFKTLADKMLADIKPSAATSAVEQNMFATAVGEAANATEESEKVAEGTLFDAAGEPSAAPSSTSEEGSEASAEESHVASLSDITTVNHYYQLVDNASDMAILRDFLLTQPVVSIDTETTSVNAIDACLVGLSFSAEPHRAYYVPVPERRDDARAVVGMFKRVYESSRIMKVGQNIKYDIEVLRAYGIRVGGPLFDTMIAHYLLRPETRHNMDAMAESLLRYKTVHIDEIIGPRGKQQKSMRDVDINVVCDYAAEDADITLQLYKALEPRLKEKGMLRLFLDVEMPLVEVLAEMELTGVLIDADSLKETSAMLTSRARESEQRIYDLAGERFNIASPRQVGDILFGKLNIADKPKKTKTGQYVTSEEVLRSLSGKHAVVDEILAFRGLKKLLTTYVDALPSLVNPRTGHIHTSFNQTVTATGRLSSSDPNLQNIPVRGEDGKEIRRAFVPEEGCTLFSADYSQVELRVMAHLSGDDNLIEAFLQGGDVHAATAAKIYKTAPEAVTREQRTHAKRANFGIIYGITVFGLASSLGISRDEAKQLIDGYYATYPKVRLFIEQAKEFARQHGYAETLLGRRRYLPDITSRNATVRGFAERNAVNAPIQGTAADIIKIAMVNIFSKFRAERLRSKMILQVHDELIFNVVPGEEGIVKDIVVEQMQGALKMRVPLIVDCGFGANWLEAH